MPAERCKDLVGKTCVLTSQIVTRGGQEFAAGTRWRIASTYRGRFCLVGVDKLGRTILRHGYIHRYIRGASRAFIRLEVGL